jgi:hypothetical protein
MLRDIFKKAMDGVPSFQMSTLSRDKIERPFKGEVFWEMRDSLTGLVTKGHIKNVVTLDASILIARFMKGTGTSVAHNCEPSFGGYALAVGTGDIAWNPMNPPPATPTQRSLFNELSRKTVSSTSFIDGNGSISGVPTNIVDFTFVFSESEAVGALAEMGIIGGDINPNMAIRNPVLPPNGTYDPTVNVVGLDTLVNYITFPAINKPATSTLTWVWRLTW